MTLFIANSNALTALDTVVDDIDAGSGAGTLVIYSGSIPANADASLAGNTVLATLTFSDPSFGAAFDNTDQATATANSITSDTSADATDTAAFFRVFDSDSNIVLQGQCGTSGQELNLNTLAIVAGATVAVTSMTVSLPES